MAIGLGLLGKLNVGMDVVVVVEKVLQLFGSIGPDHECVIHIMGDLKASLLNATFSKSSMNKLAMTGDSGEPMATLSLCLQN